MYYPTNFITVILSKKKKNQNVRAHAFNFEITMEFTMEEVSYALLQMSSLEFTMALRLASNSIRNIGLQWEMRYVNLS